MDTVRTADSILRKAGQQPDAAIDLAETALALAAFSHPQAELALYHQHLAALARDVADRADAADRAAVLRDVLVGRHGYSGDRESYDDLDNADLMRVIDRRRGLPVALSILWLHAARAQGWTAVGLNFPSHFLIRLDTRHGAVVIDPFNDGQVLDATALRALFKRIGGEDAELKPEHYRPVGNRGILLRLQNNIKLRLIKARRLEESLGVLERMILLAPREPSLWRDCASVHRELGHVKAAIACLERVAALAPAGPARHGVGAELQTLRATLH